MPVTASFGRSGAQAERRIPVGEQTDVSLYSDAVAVRGDKEAASALRVAAGCEDSDRSGHHGDDAGDSQGEAHHIVGNGEEPLVQGLPAVQLLGVVDGELAAGLQAVVMSCRREVKRRESSCRNSA